MKRCRFGPRESPRLLANSLGGAGLDYGIERRDSRWLAREAIYIGNEYTTRRT
jgi:hypothetical protein